MGWSKEGGGEYLDSIDYIYITTHVFFYSSIEYMRVGWSPRAGYPNGLPYAFMTKYVL